jgi:hypothetical protein
MFFLPILIFASIGCVKIIATFVVNLLSCTGSMIGFP